MAVFKKQVSAITSGQSLGLNRKSLKVRLKNFMFLTAFFILINRVFKVYLNVLGSSLSTIPAHQCSFIDMLV